MDLTQAPSTIVCLPHLRCNFVYRILQHMPGSADQNHQMFYVEEPPFDSERKLFIETHSSASGVTIVTPILQRNVVATGIPEDRSASAKRRAGMHAVVAAPTRLGSKPISSPQSMFHRSESGEEASNVSL